jgi:hypothetical protein
MPPQEAEGRKRRHRFGAFFVRRFMAESEIIFEVRESREGGFEARAPGFPIFTEADSFEDLREMARDAVRCHFQQDEMPALIRLHLVRDEVISA